MKAESRMEPVRLLERNSKLGKVMFAPALKKQWLAAATDFFDAQLEFADLLLVNKCDLVSEAQLGAVETFLRKVNPTAEVVRTEHSKLPPATLLGKA